MPGSLSALVLLSRFGCPPIPTDEPSSPGDSAPAEADGDGSLEAADCDDGDAAVHPGADERCNEVDGACDGAVDEDPVDALRFWADSDGDSYGEFDVATDCAYRLELGEGGEAGCPTCDFTFAADATLTAGDCIGSFTANLGFEDSAYLLSFHIYTDQGSFDVGPFDSTPSPQIGFVILDFSGPRTYGYGAYSGYLAMYPG